jgi:hypothetical protein
MNLKIQRTKLKLKHFLNVHKECKEYPTNEDYIFELVSGLESQDMLNEPFGLGFNKYNVYAIDDRSREKHYEIMQDLINRGIVSHVDGSGVRGIRYQLLSHPWMETDNK